MRRPRDSAATRAVILDAAEEVFLERGFGQTALSEIARRADVTKSLIHHHFGSKGGLWTEVKQRRFAEYASRQLEMLRGASASVELLSESFRFYFRFLERNPQLVRIMAWLFLEPQENETCLDMDRELVRAGVEVLREGQEKGLIRKDLDARFILFIFIGLAQHWHQDRRHFLHDFASEDLPDDINAAYLHNALQILLEGVVAR